MKELSLAIAAFAAVLVVAPPSASCDSFGYRTSGSKIGANSGFDTGQGGVPGGIAESGIFGSTRLSGIHGTSAEGLPGLRPMERPITGAFFFDNLFQAGNRGGGNRNNSGVLVDLNGEGLILLSGSNRGASTRKGGQFVFADRGAYHVSNEPQKGKGVVRNTSTNLAITPEPGSLFLLGTGLLGLALALFWKAARRSTGS